MIDIVSSIFKQFSKEDVFDITLLPASGSSRQYYRINSPKIKCLGVWNNDYKENFAYIDYTKQFSKHGLNVPQILFEALDQNCYFIQDLGDQTLFSYLTAVRRGDDFPIALLNQYKQVIDQLIKFQIVAGKDFDFAHAYPRHTFDPQSMQWDLNYFKYYFLKLANIPFDEQSLENDFQTFTQFLSKAGHPYFLYRDFQSRNIMLFEGKPWFIDFQGGRKGPLQYDIASLLYDAKADMPENIRETLLAYYIETVKQYIPIEEKEFMDYFYGFVFIRIMQAMGSYGFRGYYERKEHFLKSIPFALQNLAYLLKSNKLPIQLPTIEKVLNYMIEQTSSQKAKHASSKLTILINSFSFLKGYPEDPSGNGGGFVFDCRGLPNPGREEQYRKLTGKDQSVITYLSQFKEVKTFIEKAFNLIQPTIENYIERDFSHLSISFGCTGGQHRSVFCAEEMAKKIKEVFGVHIIINHREQSGK